MGTAVLAALTGRGLGSLNGLSSLAGSLLGGNNSTALFVDLLRSGTVADHLIDRFHLQAVYHKRYRVDTAKHLAHNTTITDDKKSGVISITVEDTDPRRARDLAQGYLDELNLLVNRTSTSSAHQERVFIEKRLQKVKADLGQAQQRMSEFSSTHSTVDIKEQTRAMVDAASRLQAQMILEQANLDSLRQIYGDGNVRVRATQARIAALQGQLLKISGSSAPLAAEPSPASDDDRSRMSWRAFRKPKMCLSSA
jgi:capsule polysaccharide export protein KpsE/RkpR